MTSKKKASEGIALLSMYGDEDDEMEDVEEEDGNRLEEISSPTTDAVNAKNSDDVTDYGNLNSALQLEDRGLNSYLSPNNPLNYGTPSATASPGLSLFSPQQQQQQTIVLDLNSVQIQKTRLTIVDYGHEEGAMSPEAEEGEIVATGRVMYGEQLQVSDGELREYKSPGSARLPTPNTQATPSHSLEPNDHPESDAMNYTINCSESAETKDAAMVSLEEQMDIGPFDKFLPPPPKAKCSEELQEKIIKFLALKKTTGRSFNSEVRNRKEYRNPDFLLHAVTYQDIDQIGSCFSKDVFDPHGYDKSDFYDEIVPSRVILEVEKLTEHSRSRKGKK